jgi:AmmeMemoRadiSam system protein A
MELIPLHDRKHILNYARNVIENQIIGRPILDHFIPLSCEKEYGGAFVSIYVIGELRGCVGKFTDMDPLIDVVRYTANEVLKDDRFEKITSGDLQDVVIEISIISELEKSHPLEEVEVGKHGIYVRGSNKRTGTYLPSVATDKGWNSEQFIHSCITEKAGIGMSELPDIKMYTFETDIFKEEK